MNELTCEKHLGTLEADAPGARIELVQVARAGEQPTIEMRFQAEVPGLGWVTQRRMRMAPGQIGAMQAALNLADPDARTAPVEERAFGPLTLLAG